MYQLWLLVLPEFVHFKNRLLDKVSKGNLSMNCPVICNIHISDTHFPKNKCCFVYTADKVQCSIDVNVPPKDIHCVCLCLGYHQRAACQSMDQEQYLLKILI